MDAEFLHDTLRKAAEGDEFTSKLLDIHKAVLAQGVAQPIRMGLYRSDYMLDGPDAALAKIKQVEINTISASFGSLGPRMPNLHRFVAERFTNKEVNIPVNGAFEGIVEGLAHAHQAYNKKDAVMMMVVLPNEHNSFDQKFIEHSLWQDHKVKMIRRSLQDISERGNLDPQTKVLTIDGQEVSVAYFRAGYSPDHYPTESHWKSRETIELSLAIKCPTVEYHLTGAKKIQQVLAQKEVVERFLPAGEAAEVLDSFTGLYHVEGNKEMIDKVCANSLDYVLKPQREGGGNNYYADEMVGMLRSLPEMELQSYILMDRIKPPRQPNVIVRNAEPVSVDCVGEMGVFGIWISNGLDEVLRNTGPGYLLRSKPFDKDDGGVAAGVAVLDSPDLKYIDIVL
ncbi:glutathione synthetase [Sphaeroforma arctica JP610]|uniref:Glutathione synthetase n=1 Tax=Sphaeroforma arctica JP610 TaxID=667725 RepID=A0A0L0FUZ7_9EUKA|nr:glutathione synthetase [Sphaeroforma arctica JP610]KNC80647.1 glutathione synthetase [Sphaeroforma arctica JP610]|eukprot:XP_014154549.1 glutathione synthetase [Sphaeroforma arctica JP610]